MRLLHPAPLLSSDVYSVFHPIHEVVQNVELVLYRVVIFCPQGPTSELEVHAGNAEFVVLLSLSRIQFQAVSIQKAFLVFRQVQAPPIVLD